MTEHNIVEWEGLTARDEPVQEASPAIVVDNVSKQFRLYTEKATSLKETITTRFGRRSRFEEFWALRDISLSIPQGTTYGLVGHNGSGKSTLLRLMAGIHKPTSGTVQTDGRISALLELGAGFHPELSGRENVYLNGSILGLTRREVNVVIDDIISFAGLEEFIDAPVKHYSSGMYVRLGFAVAVHVKPDILMIDEVIAVGDEDFQRRCFDHLYRLRRAGVTIVLVSHSAPLMEQMCERVAWLDHGRLQKVGRSTDVVRNYLDHVNVLQNERHAAEAGADTGVEAHAQAIDDVSSARRWGSHEIEVTGFEIVGRDGTASTAVRTGEPSTLRIHYHAKEPILEPVFGLAFVTENGVRVAGPNTRFAGVKTGMVHGDGYVDYVTDNFPLLPGGWRLSVAVVDEQMLHVYDQLEEYYELHVQPGSSNERYGLVDLRGVWRTSM